MWGLHMLLQSCWLKLSTSITTLLVLSKGTPCTTILCSCRASLRVISKTTAWRTKLKHLWCSNDVIVRMTHHTTAVPNLHLYWLTQIVSLQWHLLELKSVEHNGYFPGIKEWRFGNCGIAYWEHNVPIHAGAYIHLENCTCMHTMYWLHDQSINP